MFTGNLPIFSALYNGLFAGPFLSSVDRTILRQLELPLENTYRFSVWDNRFENNHSVLRISRIVNQVCKDFHDRNQNNRRRYCIQWPQQPRETNGIEPVSIINRYFYELSKAGTFVGFCQMFLFLLFSFFFKY